MCFSAQASFIAAAGLAVLGSLSLSRAHSREIIPFATIPFFFGVQQFFEGLVWLTINANGTLMHQVSVFGFLFFAGVVYPLWVPWSLLQLEADQRRKKMLRITMFVGVLSVVTAGVILLFTGVTAHAIQHHIAYLPVTLNRWAELWYVQVGASTLYVIATIVPFFISTVSWMYGAGILITIGFVAAHYFYYCAAASVWCFFAALASGAIYYIVDHYEKFASKKNKNGQ